MPNIAMLVKLCSLIKGYWTSWVSIIQGSAIAVGKVIAYW